jgi:hypothetical protein
MLLGDGSTDRSEASNLRQPVIGSDRPPVMLVSSVDGELEVPVDFAGDVALEAANDLHLRFPFFEASLGVGAGGWMGAHAGDHDPPQSMVGGAVTAGIEPVPDGFAGGGRDRRYTTEMGPGRFGAKPLGVVAGDDEEHGGGVGADAVDGEEAWGVQRDEGDDELVEADELSVEELGAPSELA